MIAVAIPALVLAACGDSSTGGGSDDGPTRSPLEVPEEPVENVVLVTIDTLRADHLPFYGYPIDTAPFLGDIARRSFLFEEAISASSQTAPSHGTILTGLYPSQHGAYENGRDLDKTAPCLAVVLSKQQFATGGFVSVTFLSGLKQGFQRFEYDPDERTATRPYLHADEIVSRATAWLQSIESDRPVFLWVHFFDVHDWRNGKTADPEDLAAIDRAAEVAGVSDDTHLDFLEKEHGTVRSFFRNDRVARESIRRYDARIRGVDDALKTLYRTVETGDRAGKTLWIFTADHGEGLGSHGYGGHDEQLYQEQLHVPLMFHFSGATGDGLRLHELVRTIDIYPTILAAIGSPSTAAPLTAAARSELESRSLLPLMGRLRSTEPNRLAFSHRKPVNDHDKERGWIDEDVASLRDQRHAFLFRSATTSELFDLKDDPTEQRDLGTSARPAAELASTLADQLELLRANASQQVGAPLSPEVLEQLRQLGYVK